MNFTLEPFWQAELAVQIHIVCGLVAMVTGLAIFARRKGSRWHVLTGRVWFIAMALVAVSSFFIHQLKVWGLFSPLHLFAVSTLGTLAFALYAIRKRDIRGHELSLKGLFLGGIVFAGGLTLSKGLTMHRIIFGEGGGQFMPAPGELPGGPIGFALVGGIAIFVMMFFSESSRVARSLKKEQTK